MSVCVRCMIQCAGGKGNCIIIMALLTTKPPTVPYFNSKTFANTMTELTNEQKIVKFVKFWFADGAV